MVSITPSADQVKFLIFIIVQKPDSTAIVSRSQLTTPIAFASLQRILRGCKLASGIISARKIPTLALMTFNLDRALLMPHKLMMPHERSRPYSITNGSSTWPINNAPTPRSPIHRYWI